MLTVKQLEILIAILIVARIGVHYLKKWETFSKEYLDSIIIAGLTALFLISYIVMTSYIPSGSMKPVLLPNDYIIVNEIGYRFYEPERGDIVVFSPPHKKNSPNYIKRVVGLENETIEIKDGNVYINGEILKEDYLPEDQHPYYQYGPEKIPENHFFVMGDNRNNSEDSHVWGFLPRENVVGKAELIFWPPARLNLLN